jgi:threonine synthase
MLIVRAGIRAGRNQYSCSLDGGNLDIILDYVTIRQNFQIEDLISSTEGSLWRYLPLLPVAEPGGNGTPLRAAGWTPVYSTDQLANKLGMQSLWVKDESRNPTASFKDRASALVVARAREIGAEVVVTARPAMPAQRWRGCRAVGQKSVIFAPKTAPPRR